jgi:glutathione synthase/RimK-type ligase-like ATP-grasp enzyme
VRAARLVGDGLYGVDLKQLGRQVKVIEINDNPNVDAGYEDRVAGDDLYDRFMRVFLNRILRHKNGREVSRV